MLTPIELQGKSFKTGFGYDKKDVESFFKDVIKNFEILYKENLELNDKINVLSEGVQYYKSIEKTLQKALVLAQKAAADTENAASEKARVLEEEAIQKAKKIEEDAKMKADKITSEALHSVKQLQFEATKELHQIQLDVASLLQQYEAYKIQYKQMITAQLELLESESFKVDLTSLQSIKGFQGEKEEVSATTEVVEEPANEEPVDKVPVEREESSEEVLEESLEEVENSFEEAVTQELEAKEVPLTEILPNENEPMASEEQDDMPVIDLDEILNESEAMDKETKDEVNEEVAEPETESKSEKVSFDELSEEELLQKLFAKNRKKRTKKDASSVEEDFEFLDS